MVSKMQVKKEPIQFVHQNDIWREQIRKELKYQKCFTKYSINPFTKKHSATGKPHSYNDLKDEKGDDQCVVTTSRYSCKLKRTPSKHMSPRFNTAQSHYTRKVAGEMSPNEFQGLKGLVRHPRVNSEITEYMDAALMQTSGKLSGKTSGKK